MEEALKVLQDLVENKLLAAHRNCPDCDKQPRFHVAYEKLRKCIIYQLYQVFMFRHTTVKRSVYGITQ